MGGGIPNAASCVWDVRASLELCRWLLTLAFDLEKSSDVVGASRMARLSEQVAPIPYEAGMRSVLVWACCVRRIFSPTPAYSDGKFTRDRVLARDSDF